MFAKNKTDCTFITKTYLKNQGAPSLYEKRIHYFDNLNKYLRGIKNFLKSAGVPAYNRCSGMPRTFKLGSRTPKELGRLINDVEESQCMEPHLFTHSQKSGAHETKMLISFFVANRPFCP